MNRLLRYTLVVLGALALHACGGGSDPFYSAPSVPLSPFGTNDPVRRDPIAAMPAPVRAQPAGPRVLVLYDQPPGSPFAKMGAGYAIMLQNLLGHFDAAVDMRPVEQYAAQSLAGYQATFYIGWAESDSIPAAFLQDVAAASQRVIWLGRNLQQLADEQGAAFVSQRGFQPVGPRTKDNAPAGMEPSFFSDVYYRKHPDLLFQKAVKTINGEPAAAWDMFMTQVTDGAKALVHADIINPASNERGPYVLQSGNFWFVADTPFDYAGPRDRYVIFSDLLHDMLGIDHAENHQAMMRFEDADAKVNPVAFKRVVDLAFERKVPFSVGVVPHYKDPLGAQSAGVPTDIPMANALNLRLALDYALARGGEILQHGTTHQTEGMINNASGATGIDYEFWDTVNDRPLPGDSVDWAKNRINNGLRQMLDLGYMPVAWETPHYVGSPSTLQAVAQIYEMGYQRHTYYTSDQPDLKAGDYMVDQFFPFVIERDRYGLRVLPENLGNLQYFEFGADEELTSKEVLENARYQKVVRDGFASFFFHPFLAVESQAQKYDGRGYTHLKEIVDGLTAMGYTWTSPSRQRKR